MNWIEKSKRLAIYRRDGMACVYCGSAIEDGVTLTLDHLICRDNGGSHAHTNLVTCCHKCNSVRGDRDLAEFVIDVAAYINHGVTGEMILAHIAECIGRDLQPFKIEAKKIMALRPKWGEALRMK